MIDSTWFLSLFFGVLPQALFCTLMLIFMKDLKEKQFLLFIVIFILFIACIITIRHNLLLYTLFCLLVFGALKLLYGSMTYWLDAICILMIMTIVLLISLVYFVFIPNYWTALYMTQLTLLALPFMLKQLLHKFYNWYCRIWNIGGSKKVKSITVRNVSIILFNLAIVATNYAIVYFLTQ